MKKILTLFIALLLICALISGCATENETEVLNVYNWGEYISDGSEGSLDVNAEFEKYYYEKYGRKLTVNYTTYASNEDMYNKLKSGATSYDVVIPSDYMIEKMIQEDMLLPLNFDHIPNYQYIDEQYKNDYYDPSGTYSVPYTCGYVGIIYNQDMVEEAPTDWDILWNENYKGQILQFNNPRDAFGTAMYAHGISVNTTNDAEWNKALEQLKIQKPLVQSYVMDEIFNKMKNGSAAISTYYAGDFLTMYADNNALGFVYPESGTNIFVDAMCIPAVAKNKEIAEEYINFCLSEEIAVANAEYICYASPNTLVKDNPEYIAYMNELHENALEILYPTEEITATYYENLDPETTKLMNNLWEELKIENSVNPTIYIVAGVILLLLVAFLVYRAIRKKLDNQYD